MVCNFSPLGYAPTSMIHKQGQYRTERIMAGHSQFKNIMHRKGRQDAKRAREFTRLIREVQVAARRLGLEQRHRVRAGQAVARP